VKAAYHSAEHLKYKPDDNAQGRAVRLAREKYPAANFAAEALVIYPLQRPGAPGLNAIEQKTADVPAGEKQTAPDGGMAISDR